MYVYYTGSGKSPANISRSDSELKKKEKSCINIGLEIYNKSFSSRNHFYIKKIVIYFS